MEDHFKAQSDELVAAALKGVLRGDPDVVGFLYRHYDLLHGDTKRAVFLAVKRRFELTTDSALAERLRLCGHADLATDYPHLAELLRQRTVQALRATARELGRASFGDINASSSAARYLREVIVRLPLTSLLGAKFRTLIKDRMARWVMRRRSEPKQGLPHRNVWRS